MTKLRAILRRRWPLLVITTVIGLVAGAVSGLLSSGGAQQEQIFTASQTIVANQGSGSNPLIPQDELKVTRGEVPDKAAELLGQPGTGASLAGSIDTSFDTESGSITIASNGPDPKAAQARVDAFVKAFLEVTNAKLQSDSRRQLDQYKADLQAAQAQLAQFDSDHPEFTRSGAAIPNDAATQQLGAQRTQLQDSIAQLTQQARDAELQLSKTVPYESLGPEAPHPASTGLVNVPTSIPVRALLLGLLGLLLGAIVATIIERVSRRIDTRDELVDVVDLPILAEIGFLKEAKRAHDADGVLKLEGVWAEPYRRVRSAIQFVQATRGSGLNGSAGSDSPDGVRPPRVFMITSTAPGEGKSTTAALTGHALAEVGEPTVVIGGDFRRPEVDRLMGVPRQPSILDMAQMSLDRPTVDDVVHQTRFPSLYAAPAGKGTREVAGSIEAAKEVAREAVARGATVVFDSSPLQAANDTIDLLPVVDYVILVVRSGRSTEASLRDVVDTLRRMDAKILGVVLIGSPVAGRQQTYYYDYYSPTDPVDGPSQSSGFSNLGSSRGSAPYEPGIEEADRERDPVSVRSAQPPTAPTGPTAPTAWSGTASPSPWSSPPPGPRTPPPSVPPPWSSHPPDQPAPG